MAFTSASFALFCIVGLIFYYIAPKKARWFVLLVLSYVFYLSGSVGSGAYILFTTVTTYTAGRIIGNFQKGETKEEKQQAKGARKIIAGICLFLNFGLLYFVKYWNFTMDLLHFPGNILRFNILLPLGISFYIFQSMGYIIDLVRAKYEPQKNFFKFALFVSFFPQLTQGPIGRYDALSPQLYRGNEFSFDNLKEGTKSVFWGLVKKMVIADRAAVAACAIIDRYTEYNGSMILFGMVIYCIQLYCDFSGGIDVARGVAKMFGIDMAENFKRPLFATSLADFWRRWHITLGSWLKDYLFYPITLSKPFITLGKFTRKHIKGKAGKIIPTSLATFIVYFVIGIWHGASWKYILFGCWNGVIITASLLMQLQFTALKKRLRINDGALYYKIICIVRTSLIVVMGRFITRSSGVHDAIAMIKRVFFDFAPSALNSASLLNLGLSAADYAVITVGVLAIFVLELFDECGIRLTEKIENKNRVFTFICMFICVLLFIIFGIFRGDYIASEFIYKQF